MSLLKVGAGLCRSAFGCITKHLKPGFLNQQKSVSVHSRTMWYMCTLKSKIDEQFLQLKTVSECCRCGCSGLLHTQGEKSLVEFLKTEIQEEKKSQKMSALPRELDGFSIAADGSELTFKKQNQLETITVSMNVNHSVDTDENGPEDGYTNDIRSKPSFDVDITRRNNTLSFNCSFVSYSDPGDDKVDAYQIDEVTLFQGEWNEKNYSVAGDILDENLYDLFMSFLFEKGITNEFVEQVSSIATYHEHSKYINLLEEIQKFSSTV